MEHVSPLGRAYQAGTFAGNPLVMRAGLATLKNLSKLVYKDLKIKCDGFVRNTNQTFKQYNVDAHLVSFNSMISIRFRRQPVLDYDQAQTAAQDEVYAQLFHHLLDNGIYWPPANLETFFVSTKHTVKDLNILSTHIKNFFCE